MNTFKVSTGIFLGGSFGAWLGYPVAAIAVFLLGQVGHFGATSVVVAAFLIAYPLGAAIGALCAECIMLHHRGPFLQWGLVSWLGGIALGLVSLALLDTVGGKILLILPVFIGCWCSLSYYAIRLLGIRRKDQRKQN